MPSRSDLAGWLIVAFIAAHSACLFVLWSSAPTLPMQWSLSGTPTWSAPRWLALSFLPGLAVLVLSLLSLARNDGASTPVLGISLIFLAIHLAYVFFARRYVA